MGSIGSVTLREPAEPVKPEATRAIERPRPTAAIRRTETPCDGAKGAHAA